MTGSRQPSEFELAVYSICSQIPRGHVTTYKEIAHALGHNGYMAVGQALSRNPFAPHIPCHRVVNSSGYVGGFLGSLHPVHITAKIDLLFKEGVMVVNGKIDMKKYFYRGL